MSHGNGRQQQEMDALQRQATQAQNTANTAIKAAETPDPLTQRRRDYVTKILDWRDGTAGPIDVRSFPDQAAMSLYTDAKKVTDAGRVGKGYGTLSDGANPTFSEALDKEQGMQRDLAASGELEGYINNELTGADAEAGNLGAAGDARSMAIAGMENSDANSAQDRYLQLLMKPQQPSFLKQLALGALGNVSYTTGHLAI